MSKNEDQARLSAVESVCASAQEAHNVIAICMDADGNVVVHSSIHYPPDLMWAIETAKQQLFDLGVQYDS
jgi:hypothetical protein